ncbi:MAG: L-seryl-tRNA(Sec) selenium transferase [Syntrophorhabdaceae bacterium]|jgi:L-seryl-tRNA(Ser) seleniumtransferase|nr:L-seryl-tRNA(Sec) selenium transferase [Syntrophorhabdaceae bacterium]MDI9561693.1 L-seryl-tRNA(Sec) selenium transferase [Pseudomonadota bacterium]HQG51866.1 L-seryl-tRNA(Sec) selenium transferase [Syntrophorhabdaceae bacterium]HQP52127.1 L-seryl-tRNA(Sec) selenium transferase [Syntrophorhabdaceae bacterium]
MTEEQLFRGIPKVDEILKHEAWRKLTAMYSEGMAKDILRDYLDEIRTSIKENRINSIPTLAEIIENTRKYVIETTSSRLKRVINGTGVIIHTNLGRSLLAKSAIEAIVNAASHFTNLEYDLQKGVRGERYNHCISILKRLTNAEDALVVNNNAGAVFLVLNTLAEGQEAVISRGELIEIGGSFRIPDVMKKSGAILKEVGTTNRTYKDDYEHAICEATGLIMKVHTSNYRIKGFVHETTSEELIALGKTYNLPTFYDAGSGLLFPLNGMGVRGEPCIAFELKKDWDIVSFSGDKLLGAPQAGIIVGKKSYINAMKKNPITRALRPDKFTLAALESTLILYLDEETARSEIPTLRMIHESQDVLKKRSQSIAKALRGLSTKLTVTHTSMFSEVGGGSLPDISIPSYGIAVLPHEIGLEIFEERLRHLDIPVIGRIEKGRLFIDMRTILKDDEPILISGIINAIQE